MKKKILIMLLSIILINVVIYLNFFYKNENTALALGSNLSENVGEIIEGNQIEQYFDINQDCDFNGISIMFSTFNRTNEGETQIQIRDGQNVLDEIVLNNNDIVDNNKMQIYFNKDINENAKNLNVMITSSSKIGNGITVWEDKNKKDNSSLYINGENTQGQIVMDLLIKRKINIFSFISINIFFILINVGINKFISFLTKTEDKSI